MAPVKAVVTGAAGFIGSHLADRLLADGHAVVAIDNLATGRLENLSQAKANPRFAFKNIDIAGPFADLSELMRGADWVFHLAGLADIVPSIQKPLDYCRANVAGTTQVVEAARQNGVKRLVYAASSSCYGIPDAYPTSETAEIRPQYPYALSKYLGEEIVMHWAKVYAQPSVSLRLFNVYGPRSRTSGAYGAVFGVFLAQKLKGKPFTVVGDGEQTRDFTYVSDVADAFVQAARSSVSGEIINIGSNKPRSVNELVGLLGGEKIFIPKRPGEPDCTWADTSKAARLLGWKPRVGFEEGVRRMLEHIELWRNAPVWDAASIAKATEDWFKFLAAPSGAA
jgi:UDP-glucose 4-epimerase